MIPTYENPPTKPPDLEGMGRAWRVTVPEAPQWQLDGFCGQWLVGAPHANIFWWWYCVACIALRSAPGEDAPPHIQFPGASHELLVVALSPEEPLPDPDQWGAAGTPRPKTLTPIYQCIQFIVNDDEQATELCDLVVRAILRGDSPDQDFRRYWETSVQNAAEHLRLGGHPDWQTTD